MFEKARVSQGEPVGAPSAGATSPVGASVAGGGATAPVLVDLGKKRRKQIKQLKRGGGPLLAELADVVEQVRIELAGDLDGKILLPVVLIYEKKEARAPFGLPAIFPR